THYEGGGRTCDFCYAHFKTPPFTGAHKPDCPVHLATGKLPCNHPAACDTGSGCGWCAAVAAAQAQCAAGPWRPISEAPKDACCVLLLVDTLAGIPCPEVGWWGRAMDGN